MTNTLKIILGRDDKGHDRVYEVTESSQVNLDFFSKEELGLGDDGFAQLKHDFEQMQDDRIDAWWDGDVNTELTMGDKERIEEACRQRMDALEFLPCEVWGDYLAYAWCLLKARETKQKDYTIEELSELPPRDVTRYEMTLPPDKKKVVHAKLMKFYDDRLWWKDVDWVVEKCDEVKQKLGADSRCAVEIVKCTLLKSIWNEIKQ